MERVPTGESLGAAAGSFVDAEGIEFFTFMDPTVLRNELGKQDALDLAISKLPKPLQDFFNSGDFTEACDGMFEELDTRFTMSLDAEQLHEGLVEISEDFGLSSMPTMEDTKKWMEEFDDSGNGKIDYQEWVTLSKVLTLMILSEATKVYELRASVR
eukprot:TRINITY_DN2118_c0_g1_i1.p1 TRINITY_DN2118_c0_g1~~TRINITY_DN2118_c0_g1_i1.p1  ORF type:complete len:157 (-),score=44.07 TRINITY_DN2118_c0_g1_i1:213-683(-)